MAFTFTLIEDVMSLTVDSSGKMIKTYDRKYLCKSDTEKTLDQVAAAVGVLPGAPHPDFAIATAKRIGTTRRPTLAPHCAWDHSIHYSTEGVVPEDDESFDPEDRRVKRRTGTTQQQRFIIKDRNDVLITDAAGSAIDGGVPVTDYLGTITWERDEDHTSSSMSQAAILSGKINSLTFMGCDPETLMLEVTGEEKYEGSHHFWTFTYTMVYDRKGWQPKPLNAGLYQLKDGRRERIQEVDEAGKKQNTQEPQPLYSSSNVVPGPGRVIPVASRPGSCNFLDIDHYIAFDFTTLGLPTT